MRRIVPSFMHVMIIAPLLHATANAAPPTATIEKNIVTDFGAKCDGVADDARAFAAFNVWAKAQTQLVQLTIPSGSICSFLTGAAQWWAKGIKQLLVIGYGATITNHNRSAPGFFLGGRGLIQDDKHSAQVATVSAGAASVTLLRSSQSSLFTIGRYALLAGFDLQGLWNAPYGYPPNPHFFEYVKVINIDAASGVITFDRSLKNTYKSTWPSYNSGNQFEIDNGGPATLYALDPSWDTEVEYRGLTISQPGQTYANGRNVVYRDVTFTGTACGIPTQNLSWTAISVSMENCTIEADKIVGTVTFIGGTVKAIDFQSSSIDLLVMDGTSITNFLHGTPKKAVISNSTIERFKPGAFAYGRSDEVICNNCVLPAISVLGITEKGGNGDPGVNNAYTMRDGVIIVPNRLGAVRWAVPGTNLFWVGQYANETSFRVVDVTQDVNNTYVQTTLSGGFPSVPKTDGKLYIGVHPAPQFTCANCTGSTDALDLSQAPPGAPIYSYSKRTYTGLVGLAPAVNIWGNLVKVVYNVTTPYSGVQPALTMNAMGQFHEFTIKSDYSTFDYQPVVNLKIAGERYVFPNSVVGQQSGDSGLSVPEVIWFSGTVAPYLGVNISGESPTVWPSITIEIVTDQRVVNP
jgi:hypothetical protein